MSNLSVNRFPVYESYLQIKTDLNEIATVLIWFDQIESQNLETDFLVKVRIALVEGFTNAVRHAHKSKPKSTPINIDALLFLDQLEIRIWDSGVHFDFIELLNTVEQQYPNPEEHDAHWGGTIFRKLNLEYGWDIQYHCPTSLDCDRNCFKMLIPI